MSLPANKSSTFHSLALALVTLAMFLRPGSLLAAWGFPQHPTTDQCFAMSKSIVVGEIVKVDLSEFYETGRDGTAHGVVKFRCELKVHEVCFGKENEHIAVLEHDGSDSSVYWRPALGDMAIVFLREIDPKGRAVTNVISRHPVSDYDDPEIGFIRSVARIWSMKTVAEQAEAVQAGCLSRDEQFQFWCMHTLAGKHTAFEKPPLKVHQFVGPEPAYAHLRRIAADALRHGVQFERPRRRWPGAYTSSEGERQLNFLQSCDYVLADDPAFRQADARYDLLWKEIEYCSGMNRTAIAQFTGATGTLAANFPHRAGDCVDRLTKLGKDHGDLFQHDAVIELSRFFSGAPDATRTRIVEFLDSILRGDEPSLIESAAIGLGMCATLTARASGKVPPEVEKILANSDHLPEIVQSRFAEAKQEIDRILQERKDRK